MDIIQNIDQTKQLLIEEGWVKGSVGNYQGNRCVGGALARVFGTDEFDWDAFTNTDFGPAFDEIIRTNYPERIVQDDYHQHHYVSTSRNRVAAFNNNNATTLDDVLEALDKTKELLVARS